MNKGAHKTFANVDYLRHNVVNLHDKQNIKIKFWFLGKCGSQPKSLVLSEPHTWSRESKVNPMV